MMAAGLRMHGRGPKLPLACLLVILTPSSSGNFGTQGNGIAVDAGGNAYIAGGGSSIGFPLTQGAFQTTASTAQTAFVSKLNPTGTGLVYSTLFGGAQGKRHRSR